jgi:hypothetical protein
MARIEMLALAGAACVLSPALANECWIAPALRCTTALSPKYHDFQESTESGVVLCFTKDAGTVTGDNLKFVRIGQSTLVGAGVGGEMESVSTYQIDRHASKLLYIGTRIGTAAVIPLFPDKVSTCVGNAVPASAPANLGVQ